MTVNNRFNFINYQIGTTHNWMYKRNLLHIFLLNVFLSVVCDGQQLKQGFMAAPLYCVYNYPRWQHSCNVTSFPTEVLKWGFTFSRPAMLLALQFHWSLVYIRKTYIGQSPKPQKVQIWKMHTFSGKCTHFMQIRWKCTHFQENACILCKLDENACIFRKMHAFYAN